MTGRDVARRLLSNVIEIAGESMSPTLERGWKVRVEPLDRPVEPGDVVLIETDRGPVVHRCLGVLTWGVPPRSYVVHAGDASRRPGVVPESHIRARVAAVFLPRERALPRPSDLAPEISSRQRRFFRYWRILALTRRFAEATGVWSLLPNRDSGSIACRDTPKG